MGNLNCKNISATLQQPDVSSSSSFCDAKIRNNHDEIMTQKMDLTGSMRSDSQNPADDSSPLQPSSMQSSSSRLRFDPSLPCLAENNNDNNNDNNIDDSSKHLIVPIETSKEFGGIRYKFQSLEDAINYATKRQRPILQVCAQVPGDIETGQGLLSHPLIVELIESSFVPVAIQQEKKKNNDDNFHHHVHVEKKKKPWHTIVSIFNPAGQDINIPEIGGDLLCAGMLMMNIIQCFQELNIRIPKYAELLHKECIGKEQPHSSSSSSSSQNLQRTKSIRRVDREAIFGVNDCGVAEIAMAGLPGILSIDCCQLHEQKVLRITYNSKQVSFAQVVQYATKIEQIATVIYYTSQEERVAALVQVESLKKIQTRSLSLKLPSIIKLEPSKLQNDIRKLVHDSKKELRKTPMRFVPLTNLQATMANRLIGQGKFNEAMHLLSPNQAMIMMKGQHVSAELIAVPVHCAWESLETSTS